MNFRFSVRLGKLLRFGRKDLTACLLQPIRSFWSLAGGKFCSHMTFLDTCDCWFQMVLRSEKVICSSVEVSWRFSAGIRARVNIYW